MPRSRCLWRYVHSKHNGICYWDNGHEPSIQVQITSGNFLLILGKALCFLLTISLWFDFMDWLKLLSFRLCFIYQSSSTPAEDPLKLDECRLAGKYLLELLKMDLKPRDIITEKSLRNAMVIIMALGGSTNAVLHLIAIARWVIIFLSIFYFLIRQMLIAFPFQVCGFAINSWWFPEGQRPSSFSCRS